MILPCFNHLARGEFTTPTRRRLARSFQIHVSFRWQLLSWLDEILQPGLVSSCEHTTCSRMCSVHYEWQLLWLFHSRLYQPSSQYSCHAQKDISTSGFPYPWLDIGLAAHESFEATPCSNLLSYMEGWIPQLPNQPADVLLGAAAHIVLVHCRLSYQLD